VLQLFFVSLVNAAGPVLHISPKPAWLNTYQPYDKKIPARDVDNGYFYQLFEEQIHVDKKADYTHIIKEIVSEAGIQNGSSISISFDPSFERLDVHEVTVWRNNIAQRRLSTGIFKIIADEKELSRFIYQGSYSAYCILDDIRKGDRIEYSYTITGRNPIFNDKFFRDLYFQSSQPLARIYKSILISPQRKLNFKSFNATPKVTVTDKNGLRCYEWNEYQVKPPAYADNQPGWFNNYGYLQVSEYNSWKEVTDWALKVNPTPVNLKGELAKEVNKLKAEAGNDKQKYFRAAVKMVQDEVRYMGIEMGEYSHRANNPEKIFNQRYGDCKDKALLLASVLTAGDIEAEMVLVNSSIKGHIDQFIPSPNAFDHAVVVATVNNKPVWVDATIAYQRGTGTDIYFPNYGKGLVLKPGNSSLTTIGAAKAGKITLLEKYTIPNDEKDKVKLDVTATYTLNEADKMRDRLASTSMSETEKSYLAYYTKIYPKIESADSVTLIDNSIKNELTTIEHYLITGFFKKGKEDGKYSASFYANTLNEQLPTIANKAKTPVAVVYPYNLDYNIKVIMANGWNVEKQTEAIRRDAYSFKNDAYAEKDTLTLHYQFSYLQSFIPVNKLDEAREDINKISNEELSYSFTYAPDVSKLPFRLNYWMVAAAILTAIVLLVPGIKIYRTTTGPLVLSPGHYFTPIGGWLVLIGLGLALTPVVVLITLLSNNFFDLNRWGLKLPNVSEAAYNIFFTFEALGNVILICYACFCFILLIKRRDIFPKYTIGLYAFTFIFQLTDNVLSKVVIGSVDDKEITSMVRTMFFTAIWISYLVKSTRVAQTFVMPYPASNIIYKNQDEPEESIEQPNETDA
jgi:transglutaminase-like putative cysteine protease